MGGGKVNDLLDNRKVLMGLAILFICLLHALVQANITNVPAVFLNSGVDIFLIMSAIGCTKSYNANGFLRFYRNRMLKVLPLYAIFSSLQTTINIYLGKDVTLMDYLYNASTLSYWGIGGWYQEWYVCSSFILWLTLPCLVFLVKKSSILPCLLSIPFVVGSMLYFDINPQYSLLISRIPIFIYGVWLVERQNFPIWLFTPFIVVVLLLGIHHVYCGDKLCVSFLSPIVLAFLLKAIQYAPTTICNLVKWLGGKTLEIYLANVLAMFVLGSIFTIKNQICISALICNIVMTCAISIAFVYINHQIKKICRRYQ